MCLGVFSEGPMFGTLILPGEEEKSFQMFDKIDVMFIRDFSSYVDTLYLHDITRYLEGSILKIQLKSKIISNNVLF